MSDSMEKDYKVLDELNGRTAGTSEFKDRETMLKQSAELFTSMIQDKSIDRYVILGVDEDNHRSMIANCNTETALELVNGGKKVLEDKLATKKGQATDVLVNFVRELELNTEEFIKKLRAK